MGSLSGKARVGEIHGELSVHNTVMGANMIGQDPLDIETQAILWY